VVSAGRAVATWRTGRGRTQPVEVEAFGDLPPGLTAVVEERHAALP
jgi:hypothetical protein